VQGRREGGEPVIFAGAQDWMGAHKSFIPFFLRPCVSDIKLERNRSSNIAFVPSFGQCLILYERFLRGERAGNFTRARYLKKVIFTSFILFLRDLKILKLNSREECGVAEWANKFIRGRSLSNGARPHSLKPWFWLKVCNLLPLAHPNE
jgi:hypothetical protein